MTSSLDSVTPISKRKQ